MLHLGFSLLFCVGWAVAGKVLQLALRLLLSPQEVRDFAKQAGDRFWTMLGVDLLSWIFTTLPFGVVVYLSLVGIAHAIQYLVESSEREVQMVAHVGAAHRREAGSAPGAVEPPLPVQQPQYDRGPRA